MDTFKFQVIPSEQTPVVPKKEIGDLKEYIKVNQNELDQFLDFARKHDHALGLAANQVSLNGERYMKRMFAWRYGWPANQNEWMLVIDPVIHECMGVRRLMDDGCLTWGMENLIVAERSPAIRVSFSNLKGEFISNKVLRGLGAQIWQHEVNHLNGVPEKIVSIRGKSPGETIRLNLPRVKLERNMACPCNSGKKFKNCCIQWES